MTNKKAHPKFLLIHISYVIKTRRHAQWLIQGFNHHFYSCKRRKHRSLYLKPNHRPCITKNIPYPFTNDAGDFESWHYNKKKERTKKKKRAKRKHLHSRALLCISLKLECTGRVFQSIVCFSCERLTKSWHWHFVIHLTWIVSV